MQFYVSNEASVEKCKKALASDMPITVYGLTDGNNIKRFTGVVQSVVEDKLITGSKRWIITMLEANSE